MHIISCFILSICFIAGASGSNPNITFQEHCKNSDAYLLYSYTDVSYHKTWSGYEKQTSEQSKLVINTRLGVGQFAFLNIDHFICDHLKAIQVKTFKADGTIIELDSSLVFEYAKDVKQQDEISYPIPGVEPGDTIEILYTYFERLNEYEMKEYINLYNPVPSYNTEYSIKTSPDFLVYYKEYNAFPEPQILANDTIVYCLFKMENMKGLVENQYTCLPCELPYVYYSIEKKEDESRTWKDVYNQEFNFITQPILLDYEKNSYYNKWKRRVIGEAKDSSKYYKFNLLLTDILDNIEIEPAESSEFIKSSGYFLKEKRFDPISIRRLYRQLLEDMEINYWAVFARSKKSGCIDPYYIRKGEYDHIFFAFENENGSLTLLYPHDVSFKYQINEIPTSLYNTISVIAKPYLTKKVRKTDKFIDYDLQMAKVDSVIVDVVKLPGMSSNFNYLKQTFFCDVDTEKRNATFKSELTVSGGLSTDVRSFFSMLNQNEELSEFYEVLSEYEGDESSLKIDTVTKFDLNRKIPFVYKIAAEGSLEKSLTYINDTILSLTLENLIHHTLIKSDEDTIDLNYYIDYCYADMFLLMLKFPCNIELMSFDNYKKDFSSEFGEYLFTVNAAKNQLIIRSDYKIIKEVISKDQYRQLKQLNELVQEIKNMRLMIKLKVA